jgi:hypothetical protein
LCRENPLQGAGRDNPSLDDLAVAVEMMDHRRPVGPGNQIVADPRHAEIAAAQSTN